MSRILGTDGHSKDRRNPGVHPPLGDRGGQSGGHGRARCGQWPEPSLLCADGWCCDSKPCAATQLRTAVQRGLDRFVMPGTVRASMGGKAPRAPGGDTFIAGRRLARCRAIPLSGWVVAEAWLTQAAAASATGWGNNCRIPFFLTRDNHYLTSKSTTSIETNHSVFCANLLRKMYIFLSFLLRNRFFAYLCRDITTKALG